MSEYVDTLRAAYTLVGQALQQAIKKENDKSKKPLAEGSQRAIANRMKHAFKPSRKTATHGRN